MSIEKLSKNKVMRPSLIDSVDKVNEVIDAVNLVDPTQIQTLQNDVESLQTSVADLNTRVGNISTTLTNILSVQATQQQDIDDIKVTLYTPLSEGGN